MINTELMTNNTVLKDTIDMLFDLSVDDLLEIQSFIKGNRSRNMKDAAADIGLELFVYQILDPAFICHLSVCRKEAFMNADHRMLVHKFLTEQHLVDLVSIQPGRRITFRIHRHP